MEAATAQYRRRSARTSSTRRSKRRYMLLQKLKKELLLSQLLRQSEILKQSKRLKQSLQVKTINFLLKLLQILITGQVAEVAPTPEAEAAQVLQAITGTPATDGTAAQIVNTVGYEAAQMWYSYCTSCTNAKAGQAKLKWLLPKLLLKCLKKLQLQSRRSSNC